MDHTSNRSTFLAVVFGAIGSAALLSTAHANPCTSEWTKLGNTFQKLSPILSRVICNQLNKGDTEGAQTCVDDYNKKKTEIEDGVKEYNTEAGSEKIGPRGLGWGLENPEGTWANKVYSGTLLSERTFISLPMPGQDLALSFRGTGGDSKQSYTVTVCVLDTEGEMDRDSQTHTFTDNESAWNITLPAVADKRLMVYLKNAKTTLNGHKYELTATPVAVRADVLAARATLAAKKPAVIKGPVAAPKK